MSTRANIILKDEYSELWFYRHSDGYPKGTMPILNRFLDLVKSNKIRNNPNQAGGWLIVLGAIEYQTISPKSLPEYGKRSYEQDAEKVNGAVKEFKPDDWKVGSIEPTTGRHGDIEYLYTIDLTNKTITTRKIQ